MPESIAQPPAINNLSFVSMPAHSILATALSESYTLAELKTFRRALLEAALAPDALTGEQLDGVSFQFAPRSLPEINQALENIAAAISKLEDAADGPGTVRSRFFNFNARPIE
jgi:hypothetical protein